MEMDRDDVIDLLTIIAQIDNRSIGDPEIVIWQELIGRYAKDDCLQAIMDHRSQEPGVWLEPGHVVKRVRAAVNDRYERSGLDSPERRALEQAGENKGASATAPPRGYALGVNRDFDAAGWEYGTDNYGRDRVSAGIELNARLDREYPGVENQAEAERQMRLKDRGKAEAYLRRWKRPQLITLLGEQTPEDKEDTPAVNAGDLFSELFGGFDKSGEPVAPLAFDDPRARWNEAREFSEPVFKRDDE
jgi:hypothetical protein